MNRKEVDIAIEWAANEGWNPGFNDATCYYSTDQQGFFIAYLNNEPIATISAIKYGTSFGFIGFYIVKPEYRGKGYGIQIWNTALKYLEGRNIGLDGVIEQQNNYKKSGFNLAYRNIRYEGVSGGLCTENSEIINLLTLPDAIINEYDPLFFPVPRPQFIKSWINQANGHSLGIMNKGQLVAYGVIRSCRTGYKIGPLCANTIELAESIFLALKTTIEPSKPIFIDIPETNEIALTLIECHDLKMSFETARMYTREIPEIPLNHIFGVTSFEIG